MIFSWNHPRLVVLLLAVALGVPFSVRATEFAEAVNTADEPAERASSEAVVSPATDPGFSLEAAAASVSTLADNPASRGSDPVLGTDSAKAITQPGTVEESVGAYTHSIPIGVPAYHGMEPKLTFSYSSGSRNGLMGVGWDLSGFGTIERASKVLGSPRYESSDIFLLDGQQLIRCTSTNAEYGPICHYADAGRLGDYFSTEFQSYLRIVKTESSNQWQVTQTNGTRLTYGPVLTVGSTSSFASTFRWGLQRAEDPHGNTVDYRWWCEPGGECYPDSVTYNGTSVKFYYEGNRPDRESFATGVSLAPMSYRLRFAEVRAGGGLRNVYDIAYLPKGTTSMTNRSVVASIQVHGRGAAIADNGNHTATFTPGTGLDAALPARAFSYRGTNVLPSFEMADPVASDPFGTFCKSSVPSSRYNEPPNGWNYELMSGDFNGDGCTDFLSPSYNPPQIRIWLSICVPGSGFNEITFRPENWDWKHILNAGLQIKTGDFNGDGKTDFLFLPITVDDLTYGVKRWGSFEQIQIYLADLDPQGNLTFVLADNANAPRMYVPSWWFELASCDPISNPECPTMAYNPQFAYLAANRIMVADVDGNATDDILLYGECDVDGELWCQCTLTGDPNCTLDDNLPLKIYRAMPSLNLDGTISDEPDAYFEDPVYGPLTPSGHLEEPWYIDQNPNLADDLFYAAAQRHRVVLADLDGDHAAEITVLTGHGEATPNNVKTYRADWWNHSFAEMPDSGLSFAYNDSLGGPSPAGRFRAADFNGDGKADLAILPEPGPPARAIPIYLSLGNGKFSPAVQGPPVSGIFNGSRSYNLTSIPIGDFTGDGRADVINLDSSSTKIYSAEAVPPYNSGFSSHRLAATGVTISHPHCVFTGDFDGNGIQDLAVAEQVGVDSWVRIHPSATSAVDLMEQARNGYGGTETISYTTSDWWSVGVPPMNLVKSVSVSDGRGTAPSETRYEYWKGKYLRGGVSNVGNVMRGRFLGFRPVRIYPPTATGQPDPSNSFTEINFLQDGRAPVLPETTLTYGGIPYVNSLGKVTVNDYWVMGRWDHEGAYPPYRTKLAARDDSTFDGWWNGSAFSSGTDYRTSRVEYDYDEFGNVTREIQLGDQYAAGDQFRTLTGYAPNTEKHIVSAPAIVQVFEGDGKGYSSIGRKLKEKLFYYDGQNSHDDYTKPPVKGDLTQTAHWIDPPPSSSAISTQSCPNPLQSVAASSSGESFLSRAWTFVTEAVSRMVSDDPGVGGGSGSSSLRLDYAYEQKGYDSYGNVTRSWDPLGNRTTTTYDWTYHVFPMWVTNPKSQQTITMWDTICGVPTHGWDANGVETRTDMDRLCRPTRMQKYLPDGTATNSYATFSYCGTTGNPCGIPDGQFVRSETPGAPGQPNLFTEKYFDGLGRTFLTKTRGPVDGWTISSKQLYDGRGRAYHNLLPFYNDASVTYPEITEFDSFDRPKVITHADNTKVRFDYGVRTKTTTDEEGQQRRETSDIFGRTIKVEHNIKNPSQFGVPVAAGWKMTSEFEYDLLGNLTVVKDANLNQETFTYDSLGRTIGTTSPHIGASWDELNAAGQKVRRMDALGQVTEFQYDPLGRMTRKTLRVGSCAGDSQEFRYSYDERRPGAFNIGRRTSISGPTASYSTKFNYDALGHLTGQLRRIDNLAYLTQWQVDDSGRLLWAALPDGDSIGSPQAPIQYDLAGRLSAVPGVASNAWYDAAGHLLSLDYANGTKLSREYDERRGWLKDSKVLKGATPLFSMHYASYGNHGNVKNLEVPAGSTPIIYSYDDLYQLVGVSRTGTPSINQTFTYDLAGNIRSNSLLGNFECSGSDQFRGGSCSETKATRPTAVTHVGIESSGQDYGYDLNGNMTDRMGTSIVYNGENKPVWIGHASFQYDADGDRIFKDYLGARTVYLGDDVEISSCRMRKFVPFGDFPVAQKTGSETEWLHTDHLGSVNAVFNAAGQATATRQYRPYGEEFPPPSNPPPSSLGFTGQRLDDETGLIYLHARYYDPVIGRFTSADPLISPQHPSGLNPYEYAFNNPINNTDVSGKSAEQTQAEQDELAKLTQKKREDLLALSATKPLAEALSATAGTYPAPFRFTNTGDDGIYGLLPSLPYYMYSSTQAVSGVPSLDWFENAVITHLDVPADQPGTPASGTVQLPADGNTRYACVVACDDAGNWSAPSNVVQFSQATASVPPSQGGRTEFRLSPNPATDHFNVDFRPGAKGPIFDVGGREVGQWKNGYNNPNLGSGMYFLRPDNAKAQKLVIVR
ncbi:MAG: RHS repeat-associated core domain-containing protein [Pseudomonadota bacterium]